MDSVDPNKPRLVDWIILSPFLLLMVAWVWTRGPYRSLAMLVSRFWQAPDRITSEYHGSILKEMGVVLDSGKPEEDLRAHILDHLGRTGRGEPELSSAESLIVSHHRLGGAMVVVVTSLVLLASSFLAWKYGWDWSQRRIEANGIWGIALLTVLGWLALGLAGWLSTLLAISVASLPPFSWATRRMERLVEGELGLDSDSSAPEASRQE